MARLMHKLNNERKDVIYVKYLNIQVSPTAQVELLLDNSQRRRRFLY